MKTAMERKRLGVFILTGITVFLISIASCTTAGLNNLFKPTTVERVTYKPVAKPGWKGKTIFIDFDTNYSVWIYDFASSMSQSIRDSLIEGMVDDEIFHIQDKVTNANYLYKVSVRIADPVIRVSAGGVIQSISATFRIKTYDNKDNLVTAKTRDERYDAPMVVLATNNSQREIVQNFAHNAAEGIRQMVYEGFK